jgi:flagellar biosynthesis GTPase FlhF
MFNDWMEAIGFPATPAFAARKAALLRASLGPEGARIYYSLSKETGETYQVVVERMERHFGRTASVIFNRALFTRNLQRPGESIVQYLSTLREMARKCDFQEAQFEERVRDQFAAGCSNERIRERLLQEPGTKTLEDLENLALTMERAQREAPVLASSSSSGASVNYVINNRKQRPSSSSQSSSASSPVKCTNCGRAGHASKADTCPAR